jgi:hypothetical protein
MGEILTTLDKGDLTNYLGDVIENFPDENNEMLDNAADLFKDYMITYQRLVKQKCLEMKQ